MGLEIQGCSLQSLPGLFFFFQAEDGIRDHCVTGVQTCALPISEGVMSLGRAFLAAGSSSVTVSLWQVSDESTAALMEEYYRGLLSGKKKSVALADEIGRASCRERV